MLVSRALKIALARNQSMALSAGEYVFWLNTLNLHSRGPGTVLRMQLYGSGDQW
jgi:hypothetical protein